MRSLERDKDTICALATAHGIGAISVIRISGSQAADITRKLAAFLPEKLESHKIYYGILRGLEGEPLDEVLVAYFQHGRSFTGETTFEISCHGSEAVVNEVLRQLVAAGCRPAERGEFTYRAFMHGRIDLVQAESVLALIESRSARASRLALRQLQGDLSRRLQALSDQITWVLANLEANIDYAAEDIQIAPYTLLAERTRAALAETDSILSSYRRGVLVRDGFQVALVGCPNVGKSSLLNALAQEERAIVTDVPGTTRDFVEARLQLEGLAVTLVDTAGLRRTDDPVESIGVLRTLEKLAAVDLVLYVVDGRLGLTAEEAEYQSQIPWEKTLLLVNKADLGGGDKVGLDTRALGRLPVSAVTGEGLGALKDALAERIRAEVSEDSTLLSNARHFQGLQILRACLEKSLPLMLNEDSPDLIALELQDGLKALFEILGRTYDDQVMDKVFQEFCLGK